MDDSNPLRLLAAAPHRPQFLAGALAVLLGMAWWTAQLAAMRFGWSGWPMAPIPPAGRNNRETRNKKQRNNNRNNRDTHNFAELSEQ